MTSSDREDVLAFLIEAEVYEGRVSNLVRRATHRVDPNAVLGRDPVMRPRISRADVSKAAGKARGAVAGAEQFMLGAPGQRKSRSGHVIGRGVPGYKGTQAYGHGVTAARAAGRAAGAAGSFISKGARGAGIRHALSNQTRITPRAVGAATGGAISHGRNWAGAAGALGRTGAVYGGAGALALGAGLGARAVYRKRKAKKAAKR